MHEHAGLCFSDPIMGIDPSSSTIGWSLLRGARYDSGVVKFKGEIDDKLYSYHWWLRDMVEMHRPAIIGIEEPFMPRGSNSFGSAPMVLQQFKGVTRLALAKAIMPKHWVENKTWKKEVLGNGGITTEQKAQGMIVRLISALGFEADHVDEADAICIAIYMRKKLFGRIS